MNEKALAQISRANARRMKRATAPKLTEAQIERTCSDWLALDGWRYLKTSPVSNKARAVGFGELGMADGLYLRYHPKQGALAEVMWIEWKRPKGGAFTRAKQHQCDWHTGERARGALTLIAGRDFPATIEGFQDYYRKSGLMRRKI